MGLILYLPKVYARSCDVIHTQKQKGSITMRMIAAVPIAAATLAIGVLIGTTFAQNQPVDMQGMSGMQHDAGMPMGGAASPAAEAYQAAMNRMMSGMGTPLTGDADVDFVKGMIAHHQGAIDMAKVELQFGKDRDLHKLAQEIITAQEKEIAFMEAWLDAHKP